MSTDPEVTDLVPTTHGAITVADSPLPIFSGAQMATALVAYRELQKALDRSMPDQIMTLDGKPFRKKGYWRAVAVAFKLTLEPEQERRETAGGFEDGRENFGYVVTYRATAPNGRSATGDGSCFAVEKARRFKCPHPHPSWPGKTAHFPQESCPDYSPAFQWKTLPAQATEHNIRSHAHTRAFNRAVSNLVGFGEVSAEEVERETGHEDASARTNGATASATTAERPDLSTPHPVGAHKLTNYRRQGEWHKWTVPHYDAQGGPLIVETKKPDVAAKAIDAAEQDLPVTLKVTMKRGTKGEAYLDDVLVMAGEMAL